MLIQCHNINSIEHSIVITDISYTEVTQVISTLKNSSAGWDELPTFVAKKCISGYIEPLTYLINTSFTEGVFPKELKLARVVPIFKIGDKTELTNYRPISVLSFFSKVFEKIGYTHLLYFIEQNKIIYKHQYGFRQKHSTQHAIITLVDRITNSLDKGDIVISIFLDLKKAFVTVDHPTLLNKLYEYGIHSSRGVVASAPDFERADEGSILTAGICFKSGKSECNNSGYKLTGLTWWP